MIYCTVFYVDISWRETLPQYAQFPPQSASSQHVVVVVVVLVLKMSERRSKDLYVQILHNTVSVVLVRWGSAPNHAGEHTASLQTL